MTSWPNIGKGMRRHARHPGRRMGLDIAGQGYGGIGKGRPTGARGPYPCKYPGCGLVYTPGYYKVHARTYHR